MIFVWVDKSKKNDVLKVNSMKPVATILVYWLNPSIFATRVAEIGRKRALLSINSIKSLSSIFAQK